MGEKCLWKRPKSLFLRMSAVELEGAFYAYS